MADVLESGRVIIISIVALFILGVTGYVMFVLIGGHVAPVFKYLLSGSGYENSVDMAWNAFKIIFVIMALAIFGYVVVKLFFEREPTQDYGGY